MTNGCNQKFLTSLIVSVFSLLLIMYIVPTIATPLYGSQYNHKYPHPYLSNVYNNSLNTTIRVGIDENYPPHEWAFYDEKKDQLTVKGFNIDVMREIGRRLGLEIVFFPMKWAQAVESLRNGSVDTLFMAVSKERKQYFDFSEPILDLQLGIFVLKESKNVLTLRDLNNHTVAVEKGDISEAIVQKFAPNALLVKVDNQEEGIKLLSNHEIFAFVGNYHTCWYLINKLELNSIVKQVGTRIPIGNRSIAVIKGNVELLQVLNSTIREMKTEGTLQDIIVHWFSPVEKGNILLFWKVFGIILGSLTIILLSSLTINYWLRKLIIHKTKEIRGIKNKLELLVDLFTHDMNNIFNILLNMSEILEYSSYKVENLYLIENKSYLLEAIYKIAMIREMMAILKENERKQGELQYVELHKIISTKIIDLPFKFDEKPITVTSNLTEQYYVPFNILIDILFNFLILKVLTSNNPSILITDLAENSLVSITFFFDTEKCVSVPQRVSSLYSRESLFCIYLHESIASINALAFINYDSITVFLPKLNNKKD